GDINGDGLTDLLIGAPAASSYAGASYVVFGKSGIGSLGMFYVSALTGANGFALTGFPAGSQGGSSVSSAGDINGDGLTDLLIGRSEERREGGECYVVFGKSGIGSSGTFDVSALTGANGFAITGFTEGSEAGSSA